MTGPDKPRESATITITSLLSPSMENPRRRALTGLLVSLRKVGS